MHIIEESVYKGNKELKGLLRKNAPNYEFHETIFIYN